MTEENNLHLNGRYDKKHIFTITDTLTGKSMTSVGEYDGGHSALDGSDVVAYYHFKTADNESGVKEIKYDNGKYAIETMMRNRPIPSSYKVTAYKQEEKYTEDEKECLKLRSKIHEYLKYRCGMGNDYLHYPNGVILGLKSINKTIVAEYFTCDWFGTDDIINYRTDKICMSELSKEDLELVFEKMF